MGARLGLLSPHPGQGCLDFLLEAGDQFAVGVDQRLLGFDLGDDGLLDLLRESTSTQVLAALTISATRARNSFE